VDFERVKAIHLAHLKQRDSHPDHLASIISQRELLKGLPNQRDPLSGYEHTVAAIEHHHILTRYGALAEALRSGHFISAGSADQHQLASVLTKTLVSSCAPPLPKNPPVPLPIPVATPLRALIVAREGVPQTVIRLLTRAAPLGAPEGPAIRLANTIFGGSFTSRLNQNLRERHGFTYGANTSYRQGSYLGLWALGTTVKADVTGRALHEILVEIDRMRTHPFTEVELEKARASERTDRIQEFESTSAMVAAFAPYAAAGLGSELHGQEALALESTSLDRVRTVGIAPMTLEGAVLVLVGDPNELTRAVESVGISSTTTKL
jgi:predicted Zn-dependent peptidase